MPVAGRAATTECAPLWYMVPREASLAVFYGEARQVAPPAARAARHHRYVRLQPVRGEYQQEQRAGITGDRLVWRGLSVLHGKAALAGPLEDQAMTASRSPAISAAPTHLTRRSPTSPKPTPTRTNATTPRFRRRGKDGRAEAATEI